MAVSACPHCAELQQRVGELEAIVRQQQAVIQELTAKLGQNAGNSSIPPSANPPGAPKPVVKPKSKRPPGAQPGHAPHLKQLLPPERVKTVVPFVPDQCPHCHTALPAEA